MNLERFESLKTDKTLINLGLKVISCLKTFMGLQFSHCYTLKAHHNVNILNQY